MFKKISIFVFAALILLCGCKTELSDYFFDEYVLKYYNISGLEKPEDIENESWSHQGSHHFTCTMKEYEEFREYAKKAFDLLNESGYCLARPLGNHKTTGEYFTFVMWYEAEISDNFEDYSEHFTSDSLERYSYTFFYSVKGLEKETSTPDGKNKGKPMKNAYCLVLSYFLKVEPAISYNTAFALIKYTDIDVYVLNS